MPKPTQRQLDDEEDLAYALDLIDAIESTRVQRDAFVQQDNLEKACEAEALRNSYITRLSVILKRPRRVLTWANPAY